MIVGMFGSRYGTDEHLIERTLLELKNKYGDDLIVFVGDCVGVDEQVYKLCKKLGIKVNVVKTFNNWNNISYDCDINDIYEIVGTGISRLRDRLRSRSIRLVEIVNRHNGIMIGFNVSGKGSKLVMNECKKLGVPYQVVVRW